MSLKEEFEQTFSQETFPEKLLRRYEPTACLNRRKGCETFLLKDRETEGLYVAKAYGPENFEAGEGAILEGLEYPGIPRMAGEYRENGSVFVLRQYVPGQTLQELAGARGLPTKESVEILQKLCDLVAYLQAQKPPVIHRDIKPSNVVVDPEGKVWLIDFEAARRYDAASEGSDTLLMCTPDYAAPEQFGYAQTDGRSDVYSMGVLLLYLLSGQTQASRAREWVLDSGLLAVIEKATQFSPKDRYENARAMKKALMATGKKRVGPWRAIVAALGLCLLGGAYYWGAYDAAPALPAAVVGESLAADAASPALSLVTPLRPEQTATPGENDGRPYAFASAQVEQAARMVLGKLEGEPVLESELSQIREIGLMLGAPILPQDIFTLRESYRSRPVPPEPAPLESLEDLKRFSNVEKVSIGYAVLPDMSPFQSLAHLRDLELVRCKGVDLEQLRGLPNLKRVDLLDSPVADLSPLGTLPHLNDLNCPGDYKGEYGFFAQMTKDFLYLSVGGQEAARLMPYLQGKNFDMLNLPGVSGLTMDMLTSLGTVKALRLDNSPVSFAGIENIRGMEKLFYNNARITDLEALLKCKELKTVLTDPINRPQIVALPQPLPFEVVYN